MGSDDLFHKRKARRARNLARRKAKRKPYAKVLIVCEGKKTEPHYLNGLKDSYSLNSANIEIHGQGKDPLSIFRYARQRFREEKEAGDPFDRVYCVFDKDQHSHYNDTITAIQKATPKRVFIATTSVPCFEYWLLLHFYYTTRPYAETPAKSAGQQVEDELRSCMPDYTKGRQGIFYELEGQLEQAKANAKNAIRTADRNDTDNPSTHVHELVNFLQNIKSTH